MRAFLELAQALKVRLCSPVSPPPGFFDITVPHSSISWFVFGVAEFGLCFLAMFYALTLWAVQQRITLHRWRRMLRGAGVISTFYILVITFIMGLYILWGDAIEVWFRQANALPNQQTCYVNAVSSEHAKVLAAYNDLLPVVGCMLGSLLMLCVAVAIIDEVSKRRQRSISNVSI